MFELIKQYWEYIPMGGIASALLFSFWKKNNAYYHLLDDFSKKFPINKGTHKSNEELKNTPFENIAKIASVVDLSTQKINMSQSDLEQFINSNKEFDLQFILFKSKHKRFMDNIISKYEDMSTTQGKLNLHIIQKIIMDEKSEFKFLNTIGNYIYSKKNNYSHLILVQFILSFFPKAIYGNEKPSVKDKLKFSFKFNPFFHHNTLKEELLYSIILLITTCLVLFSYF